MASSPSDYQSDLQCAASDAPTSKSPISLVILPLRAQASKPAPGLNRGRCETQAPLSGKPPSYASVSVPADRCSRFRQSVQNVCRARGLRLRQIGASSSHYESAFAGFIACGQPVRLLRLAGPRICRSVARGLDPQPFSVSRSAQSHADQAVEALSRRRHGRGRRYRLRKAINGLAAGLRNSG